MQCRKIIICEPYYVTVSRTLFLENLIGIDIDPLYPQVKRLKEEGVAVRGRKEEKENRSRSERGRKGREGVGPTAT